MVGTILAGAWGGGVFRMIAGGRPKGVPFLSPVI